MDGDAELRDQGTFVGRQEELAQVTSCISAASNGQPQIVWIEGDAGSGKTTLLRHILASLPGEFKLLRSEGDELAMEPSMAVVARLGQIRSANPFTAGLELLRELGELQDSGPVAVVIEDLHWVDSASRKALLTTARHLEEDRVVMLLTSRPQIDSEDGWNRFNLDPEHCQRVTLGALSADEIADLATHSGSP